jgi:hypothetical protein
MTARGRSVNRREQETATKWADYGRIVTVAP